MPGLLIFWLVLNLYLVLHHSLAMASLKSCVMYGNIYFMGTFVRFLLLYVYYHVPIYLLVQVYIRLFSLYLSFEKAFHNCFHIRRPSRLRQTYKSFHSLCTNTVKLASLFFPNSFLSIFIYNKR